MKPLHRRKIRSLIKFFKDVRSRKKERNKRSHLRKKRRRKELIKQAKDKPCHDCGLRKENMTFDHVRGQKKFDIDPKKGNLAKEIAKCDVVCRDCHDGREFLRGRMFTKKKRLPDHVVDYLTKLAI